MLGPSLRIKNNWESPPPPWGRKMTARSPSPPPLIQARLSHNRPWFRVSVMNLINSETSSKTKWGCDIGWWGSRILFQRKINVIVLISWTTVSHPLFIDGWLRMGLPPPPPPQPPPGEFWRYILSCREFKVASFKRCLHSVRWGVSM